MNDSNDSLSLARAALDAYDYDGARALLEPALLRGTASVEAARLLLELMVDVLGADADALALEPKLSRAARRDDGVRCRLGTAAARMGDSTTALAWVEGIDTPGALGALLPCARRELEAGELERCQALLERAQRLEPMDPGVSELARALNEEKRFRVLVLEEELDGLLTRGDTREAERVARALRARDSRNAKALALLEDVERRQAEAAAMELLARQVSEPAALAERPQRIQQLRAAARAPLPEALRLELTRAAEALEAAAAEAAQEAALERLLEAVRAGALSPAASSIATLAALYLELPAAARRVARERTGEPLFDWLDALDASAPLQRPLLRALEALRSAASLEAANTEAALALLEPEMRALRRLPAASALYERLTEARQRVRRAAAEEALAHAEAALREGHVEQALEQLARVPRANLDPELHARADALAHDARAHAGRQRLEQAVALHRRQGHPVSARRALDELLGSGVLGAEAHARALEQRQEIDAEVRALFAVKRIPAPLGGWWRARVVAEQLDANPPAWADAASGRAIIPVHAQRCLLLVELALDTGEAVGATWLRLPPKTRVVSVSLHGERVSVLTDTNEVLELHVASGEVESHWHSETPSPEVERSWLTRDGRRLWSQRRASDPRRADGPLQLIDVARRAVIAEYEGAPGTVRVLGHSEVGSVVVHRQRALALDAAGHRVSLSPPLDCTAAAAHPSHDGLLVSTVDYDDTGALTLREVHPRHPERALEVEDISGESPHTVGVSREHQLVAVLGRASQPELLVYRATPEGLALLWRCECGSADLVIGDHECRQLHLLRGERAQNQEAWLARIDGAPIALAPDDAPLDPDPEREAFAGFELWRCAGDGEDEHAGEEPDSSSPAREFGASERGVDAFLRAHPNDYRGLYLLWSSRAWERRRNATESGVGELERLARAHPQSFAVNLLGAHEDAQRDRWSEVERWLAPAVPDDAAPSDARHCCHLRALACLHARDTAGARRWIEEGLRHEGPCPLRELLSAIEPLPTGVLGTESPSSPVMSYRLLLRELDAQLEQQPERVVEHPALGVTARHSQLLARLAAAWLRIEPRSAEQRAWRTLDLARFRQDQVWADKLRPEWLLPEAWSDDRVAELDAEACRVLEEEQVPGQKVDGSLRSE